VPAHAGRLIRVPARELVRPREGISERSGAQQRLYTATHRHSCSACVGGLCFLTDDFPPRSAPDLCALTIRPHSIRDAPPRMVCQRPRMATWSFTRHAEGPRRCDDRVDFIRVTSRPDDRRRACACSLDAGLLLLAAHPRPPTPSSGHASLQDDSCPDERHAAHSRRSTSASVCNSPPAASNLPPSGRMRLGTRRGWRLCCRVLYSHLSLSDKQVCPCASDVPDDMCCIKDLYC
jgi:hypothetical protein